MITYYSVRFGRSFLRRPDQLHRARHPSPVLRAHSPEADLASLRRRTVPRTATEGTAARKFVMLDLTPRRDPGVSASDIPFSLAAYFQSGSDSIARPKMALQVVFYIPMTTSYALVAS